VLFLVKGVVLQELLNGFEDLIQTIFIKSFGEYAFAFIVKDDVGKLVPRTHSSAERHC